MASAKEENEYIILVSLNPKKATGNHLIPPKVFVKLAEILSMPLTDVMNPTITNGIYPSNAKLASVKPTRRVYNGPRVVKFISAKRKMFWSKMIFEQKQIRKMHKSCIIND